jgi:hypothetical protein
MRVFSSRGREDRSENKRGPNPWLMGEEAGANPISIDDCAPTLSNATEKWLISRIFTNAYEHWEGTYT